jgi:hypothetical protein
MWCRIRDPKYYEFAITIAEVAELEHPDELVRQEFMTRCMERHQDVFNDE